MSERLILTDDAVRAALAPAQDLHASDDLREAILTGIETARPTAGWWIDIRRRGRVVRFVALAAIVVLLLVALALIAAGTRQVVPPLPLPPVVLRTIWNTETRSVAGLGSGQNRTSFEITAAGSFIFNRGIGGDSDQLLKSDAVAPAPGQLRLTLIESIAGCARGDVGTYSYALSPLGGILTIDPGTDACAVRAAALPGQWNAQRCQPRDDACLGDLDPGEHRSAFFDPRWGSAGWTFEYGRLTYTVPAGWSDYSDAPGAYALMPQTDYARATDSSPYHAIYVFPDPAISAQDADCSAAPQPGVGRSVAALTVWIVGQKSLTVSAPTDITINGRAGKAFDVRLAPTWKKTCPEMGGKFTAPLLRMGDDSGGWDWRMSAPERWHLILLDIGEGNVVAIIIDDSSSPSRFDELVTQAMPIVLSFQFIE